MRLKLSKLHKYLLLCSSLSCSLLFFSHFMVGRRSSWLDAIMDEYNNRREQPNNCDSQNVNNLDSNCTQIPRILHYTFASENVYSNYQDFISQCLALNPDWQVYLWRDADGDRLIRDHYPDFADKFAGYRGDLQKSDAVRYAVLHRFGGVYLDMDIECKQPLFPRLQKYQAFIDRDRWEQTTLLFGNPLLLMNSAMGSVPRHPFFMFILHKLKANNGQSPVFSTGPVALTKIYVDWLRSGEARRAPEVTLLPSQVFSGLIDQNNPAVFTPCSRLPAEFRTPEPSPEQRRKLAAELSGFEIDRPNSYRGRDVRRMACASLALTDWRRGLHDNWTIGVHRFLHLGYGFAASKRGNKFNLLARFPRLRLYNQSVPRG